MYFKHTYIYEKIKTNGFWTEFLSWFQQKDVLLLHDYLNECLLTLIIDCH